MRKSPSGNILHVTHPWGGGISTYLEDLKGLLGDRFEFYVLKCCEGNLILECGRSRNETTIHYSLPKTIRISDFYHGAYADRIHMILKEFDINIVHMNSSVGHTFDIFKIPKLLKIPLIFTVHDFYHICPTFHMVDKNGIYCNGCELGKERNNCLKNHPYIDHRNFSKDILQTWRYEFVRVKENIDQFIFPSFSARDIFSSFFDLKPDKCRVIYHGFNLDRREIPCGPRNSHILRVGILGSMLKHKGESLVKFILKRIGDHNIRFYHFGDGNIRGKRLLNYGPYDRSKIVDILQEHKIDLILLLSTWPETFSYTLSESIAAGIPPIVTNMGALKERLDQQDIGWVVDYDNPEKICRLIRFLRKNRGEIEAHSERINRVHLKSMGEMEKDYLDVYLSVLSKDVKFKRFWQKWKQKLFNRWLSPFIL